MEQKYSDSVKTYFYDYKKYDDKYWCKHEVLYNARFQSEKGLCSLILLQ